MKVLCATDFSIVSVNAIEWVFELLKEMDGGKMEIVHCVDIIRRAELFPVYDDKREEKAIEDMMTLEKKYLNSNDVVQVSTSVHKASVKSFLPTYAIENGFNLIVTGTTGLTSLKDMLVGSVTDHISRNSDIPLLTIPSRCKFKGLDNVVVGIGKEELKNASNLSMLHDFLEPFDPRIILTQILKKDQHTISVDLRFEEYLIDLKFEYMTLEEDGSVINTLNKFCNQGKIDLLCMVHYKRNWIDKLLHKSFTKAELFSIEHPLLIIHD